MFNEFGRKKNNRDTNISQTLLFLVGGALGVIGTYFFATEKGIASRKKIAENANDLSSNVSDKVIYLKDKFAQMRAGKEPANNIEDSKDNVGKQDLPDAASNEEESTVPSKAQSMVSHLKHTKSSNNGEPS